MQLTDATGERYPRFGSVCFTPRVPGVTAVPAMVVRAPRKPDYSVIARADTCVREGIGAQRFLVTDIAGMHARPGLVSSRPEHGLPKLRDQTYCQFSTDEMAPLRRYENGRTCTVGFNFEL